VSASLRWDEVPECDPAEFTVLTMPERFAGIGDPHASFGDAPGSLDGLLELAAKDEREGLGDAPWPPHFAKGEGEPTRVQPSKAKAFGEGSDTPKKVAAKRTPKYPLITIANSTDKAAALTGLERWKTAHAATVALLAEDDVLVDRMRGRSTIWYRVRVNLRNVPEGERPEQGTPDPDEPGS